MEIKITKCPPGEAIGARDLQKWGQRRTIGQSGVPLSRKEWLRQKKREKNKDPAEKWLRGRK